MSTLDALLIAFALAMDCFTVSISCGIMQKYMGLQVWVMATLFGLFQSLMTLCGWYAVGSLSPHVHTYDQWVAFVLLLFLGGKMIWDGMHPVSHKRFNPSRVLVLILLAIATSIDALAIGCSFVGMEIRAFSDVIIPLFLIGFISFLMSVVGKYIGVKIGHRFNWPAEQVGGAILILIGIKVIIQHLSV